MILELKTLNLGKVFLISIEYSLILVKYWTLQIAHSQNDSGILINICGNSSLGETAVRDRDWKGKKGKWISLECKVTRTQRQDAALAFLPLTGIRRDCLLKGSRDHFSWEPSIQMRDHTPQSGEGPITKTVLFCIRVYDQGK